MDEDLHRDDLDASEIQLMDQAISDFDEAVLKKRVDVPKLDPFIDISEFDAWTFVFTGYLMARPTTTPKMLGWAWCWYESLNRGCSCAKIVNWEYATNFAPNSDERKSFWVL